YKYNLFVGLDANFRLENKLRKIAKGRAINVLGDGLGYFAKLDGEDGYIEQLKKHISEEDVQTCAGFQAIMQRDTRFNKGLRATGLAACSCTRHEGLRPNGIGDMIKGERFSSMDYLFCAGIQNELVLRIMVSYDIGCVWKVYLLNRLAKLPESIGGPRAAAETDIEVSLPVWHAGGHDCKCAACESLRHKIGAGMTDAEGVERIWAVCNTKSYATREMHLDTRHSALEDHFDHHNWSMNLRLRNLLGKRYRIAQQELEAQITNHNEVSKGVDAEILASWMDSIRAWHEQEKILLKNKTVPNPYLSTWREGDITEKQIREDLAAAEAEELQVLSAETAKKKITVIAFVSAILQVEQIQLKIKSLQVTKGKAAYGAEKKIDDARKAFWPKFERIRRLQASFMPLVIPNIEAAESAAEELATKKGTTRTPELAENVKLWLPSEIPKESRTLYNPALFSAEQSLRSLQCSENLDAVRLRLYTLAHILRFKNKNLVAQKASTRAKGLLQETQARLASAVRKYRAAYKGLVSLAGFKEARPYRRLKNKDVTTKFFVDYKAEAARRLTKLASGASRRRIRAPVGQRLNEEDVETTDFNDDIDEDYEALGEELLEDLAAAGKKGVRGGSKRTMSWIWTANGAPDEEEATLLHDAVRVEWCKSYSRMERWQEEVILLEEEM
ncbi:hypothetical protein CYLTODRAFT_482388, partial [Cylindrobasidium torrendii FP15055 ss-10]